MPHDEDVRLVRELTLYPIQPYPARGATANAAFGRILARYDALVAGLHDVITHHEAINRYASRPRENSRTIAICEHALAESGRQSHDVMTTSDREEQT